MIRFSTAHRDRSMLVIVSYENVPMPRGLAFMYRHIQAHGAHADFFSCDRRAHVIRVHNRAFGTHLMSQPQLIALAASGHGNPANAVNRTSHCRRSDGNRAYVTSSGKHAPPGALIPWFQTGTDCADHDEYESVDRILRVADVLGYDLVQPYPVGGEKHHLVLRSSPIPVLEHWNLIAKERH